MGRGALIWRVFTGILLVVSPAAWPAEKPASQPSTPAAQAPIVPPAKPGVFSLQKRGAARYHLAVAGHKFTSRDEIEKYLLYRAAELSLEQKSGWFTLIESRSKSDTQPVPKIDPAGPRYSFRMVYWRPVWRYKLAGQADWKSWSPFTNASFWAGDAKTMTDFEVSADILLHKGAMNDADPLAFEAGAVSDLLVNQVSPPE